MGELSILAKDLPPVELKRKMSYEAKNADRRKLLSEDKLCKGCGKFHFKAGTMTISTMQSLQSHCKTGKRTCQQRADGEGKRQEKRQKRK